MPEVAELGVVIVPAPLIKVQIPVPTTGTFPAKVAVVPHTLCGGPATDTVGDATIVTPIVTLS